MELKSLCVVFALLVVGLTPASAQEKKEGDLPEWVEIQSRLQTLKARIAAKEKVVRELIIAKDKEKDPRKVREHVEHLKREHKELRTASEDYSRNLNLLRYRYPEKGIREERQYRRSEVKSLEEMEKEMSLEGRLQAVSTKIRRQYDEPSPPKKEKNPESEPQRAPAPSITEPPVLTK